MGRHMRLSRLSAESPLSQTFPFADRLDEVASGWNALFSAGRRQRLRWPVVLAVGRVDERAGPRDDVVGDRAAGPAGCFTAVGVTDLHGVGCRGLPDSDRTG